MLKSITSLTLATLLITACGTSTKVEEPVTTTTPVAEAVIEPKGDLLIETLQGPWGEDEVDGMNLILAQQNSIIQSYESRVVFKLALLNSIGSTKGIELTGATLYTGWDEDEVVLNFPITALNPGENSGIIDVVFPATSEDVKAMEGLFFLELTGIAGGKEVLFDYSSRN